MNLIYRITINKDIKKKKITDLNSERPSFITTNKWIIEVKFRFIGSTCDLAASLFKPFQFSLSLSPILNQLERIRGSLLRDTSNLKTSKQISPTKLSFDSFSDSRC